ncbi:MAG: PAS domain-containing sensor histidine kinase [Alphaproteobacteria bacterium]|nr:MAG: PAS domain-containing sensor histidine kinase [Alphaproteobacteria bacterium]
MYFRRRGCVGLVKPVREYIDSLVHQSAQQDALLAARHRAFIGPRLLGSLVALAAFPVYLIMRGVPSALEIAVFAWLIVPILIAYFLSRTGRYEGAHVLSSLSLTGLVAVVAWGTGGLSSFAAIWLVVVPLEAALSASRRVVALASMFALSAAGLLMIGDIADILPPSGFDAAETADLAALGIISASLYATGLALGAESLARTSFWLLYAEEDRYRLLARNMTDVITRHGAQGAVLFVSPAAESLFGTGANDLLGHGLFDRVHVADRPAYLTALADAATGGAVQSVEFRVRRRSEEHAGGGQFIWVEMRCRPFDQPVIDRRSRREREVVAVMRDVTERKEQEEALEQARSESERANAAKTRFLATMSHELRTPLNAIIGFSEMLTNEVAMRIDADRRRDYATLINESGHHLLAVVNGILDMSKMETGDFEITPEPFAVQDVIRNCCDLLALKARESGVTLVNGADDDLPDLVADKRAVKQVMLNLISNAIKFTDEGGEVTVSARHDSGGLAIVVADNGIGISENDLPHVGNPFFQARSGHNRRHDGTGLGLSIVKGLVGLHGGDLEVKSTLGVGTRITVRLPFDCERPAPAAAPSKVTHGSFGSEPSVASGPVKKSA